MRGAAAIALAALIAGCAHYEIVGYYAAWKDPIAFDARDVTVVNYAFADFAFEKESPAFARLAAAKRDNPRLRVMASVGGWTDSWPFSDLAANPAARAKFTVAAIRFMRRHGFDGIDLDWEYPTAIGVPCAPHLTCQRREDKVNFVALVKEMRAAFDAAAAADGKRYLLTIAAGADEKFLRDPEGSATWIVDLATSLDWINVMTYDFHGSWEDTSGLNAPLGADPRDRVQASAEASVARFLAAGIAPSKLTLGIPFYGKKWADCEAGPAGDGLYQPCKRYVQELDFKDLGDTAGFVRHWNVPGRVPYLYNAGTRVFVTYDDEASIREKARLVRERGLLGAMFWQLGGDRDGVLRRALASELPH